MEPIYLDNCATTKMDVRALDAMIPLLLQRYGNASSLHSTGQEASKHLEEARGHLASALGCSAEEVVFTSGGTEANNLALFGVMRHLGKGHLVVSAIEHSSVLQAAARLEEEGFSVTYLCVDHQGHIDANMLRDSLRADTHLVSIMHANNETGCIQDISALADICHEKGILFHTDAVQSFGKIPVDMRALGVDLLSVCAHKIHGPKGIGALVVRKGVQLSSLLAGGSQERGLRPGTVDVACAVGLDRAISLMSDQDREHMQRLGMMLRQGLCAISGAHLNGSGLAHVISIRFDDVDGEALMFALNAQGVMVSMGSACSAKERGPSHVLLAMGLDTRAASSSLRFSLSKFTTEQEVKNTIEIVGRCVDELRL